MTSFHGTLTSPAFIQAGYGKIEQHKLQLYKTDSEKTTTLLATIDLNDCSAATTGDIQQGHHWEINLHCSPSQDNANGSKLRNNSSLAKLRRKSSIGAPKAIERLSQSTSMTDSPSSTSSPSSSSSSASPSSKSALWLKSKFRSKSISAANPATLAMTSSTSSSSLQQPLPANASAIIAKNVAISTTTETTPRRPTSANDSSSDISKIKSSSRLILSTISRELQLQWIEALSIAISLCAKETNPTKGQGNMSTSSSLPTLALHASPSTSLSSDLAGYAFPRKPSPSPLRMTTVTNQAILSEKSAAPSPTTSFLEMGRSSSSRSSTPSSFRPAYHNEGESRTTLPSPTASAYRQTPGSPNPLLPHWLSDVRRNSSGNSMLDDVQARYSSRSPSPAVSSRTNNQMPMISLLERPSMRQSKSSSFLNLDPRGDRILLSPPMGHMNSPFPDRGIKISIHPDEEDDQRHRQQFQHRRASTGLSASQPARVRRSSARTYDDRPPTPPIYISSALSSNNSSTQNLGIQFDGNTSTSSDNLLRTSKHGHGSSLRPSLSSASLSSSNGGDSSLCGGGESVSSTSQSLDPPTPCPPFIENLGTPQSCEMTPTCLSEGNSKMKLQGYFGVPQEIVENQKGLQSPSMNVKPKHHKQNNGVDGAGQGRVPLHTRFGAVFSSSGQRTSTVASPTLTSPEDKDKGSIKSTISSISMSTSSCNTSRQSVTSPVSSHVDSASTSRKSSSDLPSNVKADIGRHIIDPAELRRLMQERLDSSTSSSSSSHHVRNARRSGVVIGGTGMKKSVSMQTALDSYARSPSSNTFMNVNMKENLSASTNTSADSLEYQKYTFGKAHPAQAPSASSFSPSKERFSNPIPSPPLHYSGSQHHHQQSRILQRSESANSINVQALFAALPPPKRRSAGPVRPSTASGTTMPPLQETGSHTILN